MSTTQKIKVTLLKHQAEALYSKKKFVAMALGLGGGKTWTGAHWVIKKSLEEPKSKGFIGATTHSQLHNSTLAALFEELLRLNIDWTFNKVDGKLTILGKQWLCKSLENYNVLRGAEFGCVWADEVAYIKEEAFKVLIGRLRDKRGSLQMLLTTTPKGFNWFWAYFHPDGPNYAPDLVHLIRGTSQNNKYLPDGYLETLRSQYDDKMLKQELGGEFVNIATGQIYYQFSRNHVYETNYQARFPIYVGMDFNPHRMSAVIGQVIGDKLHIIGEIFDKTPGSNTNSLCQKLIAKYGINLTVIPDSTGNKATSNASRSDIQIIKDNGLKVSVSPNPFRIDRYAAVNMAFYNNRVQIDPSCKALISDLEGVSYKENSDQMDTSNPDHGHMSDAFGYLLYKTINPLHSVKKPVTSQPRISSGRPY